MSFVDFIILVIQFVVCFLLVVITHECGHWLLGEIFGYGLKKMSIGPFIFEKNDNKMIFSLERERKHISLGKIELQIKDINCISKKGLVMLLCGGPFGSFVLSIIAFIVADRTDQLVFLYFSALSFGTGTVSSLLPIKRRGFYRTDGKVIFEILKGTRSGINEYNIWFLYQCELLNLIEKKDKEIAEILAYMLEYQDGFDILYPVVALLFILEHPCEVLEENEAIQRLNSISESANEIDKEWIQSAMKTIPKLTI